MKNRRLPRNVGCGLLALLPACGWVLLGDAGGTGTVGSVADAGGQDAGATPDGGPTATVSITPSNHDFGSVVYGEASAPFTFIVSNAGDGATGPLSIAVTGTDSTDFAQTNACPTTLGAGGSCSVSLSVTSSATGAVRSATLIASASPGGASSAALTATDYAYSGALTDPTKWATAGASGFGGNGAVFDGRYLYLVGGLVGRYDTQAPFSTGSSWSSFDLNTLITGLAFTSGSGAAFDGRYVYVGGDPVPRYDTQAPFASASSWSAFDVRNPFRLGGTGAVFDGRYVYFAGVNTVARYDTQAPFASTTFDDARPRTRAMRPKGGRPERPSAAPSSMAATSSSSPQSATFFPPRGPMPSRASQVVAFPDDGGIANESIDWLEGGLPVFVDGCNHDDAATVEAVWERFDQHIGVWVADARFVLDQVAALGHEDPQGLLTGRLDLAHVGMFGHSFGGATAAEVCALDPRFSAGINLDGTMFSPARLDGGRAIPTPFMLQLNDTHDLGYVDGSLCGVDNTPANTWARLQDAGYAVQISGAGHVSFMDVPLEWNFFSGSCPVGWCGLIDPRRALLIADAYILAFFQHYLQGTNEPLLAGPSPYPEVFFYTR
jgi:Platelet-activating factor acetylhydrolase, isoform II